MKVIDYLLDNPQPKLEFAINTNACPPDKIWKRFIKKVNDLIANDCIKTLTVFTSAEAKGKQNNYIRFGMDYDLWLSNLRMLLHHTKKVKLSIMCAVNMLSTTTLHLLIRDIQKLRKNSVRVNIDFAYVRNPKFLDIRITPKELLDEYVEGILESLEHRIEEVRKERNPNDQWMIETEKFLRIYNSVNALRDKEDPRELELTRYNFVEYITEYDKRKGTNFKETFPEFVPYFDKWAFTNV